MGGDVLLLGKSCMVGAWRGRRSLLSCMTHVRVSAFLCTVCSVRNKEHTSCSNSRDEVWHLGLLFSIGRASRVYCLGSSCLPLDTQGAQCGNLAETTWMR